MRKTFRWQQVKQSPSIPKMLKHWLTDEHSLTEKLIALSRGEFEVELVRQERSTVSISEMRLLSMRHNKSAIVREVILKGHNTPWVYARTVIPLSTLKSHRWLAHLHNKPLGQVLFKGPSIIRAPATIGQLAAEELPQGLTDEPVWARRSLFFLQSKPILVGEAFLPSLLAHTVTHQ